MTATTTTRTRTARKVIGSLGIVGAAAAVAGMGTFGSFTDSTTPLAASVTSGTLDIDLAAAGSTALPIAVNDFVPGDSVSRAIDLSNKGSLDLGSLALQTTASTSSVLTTDVVNGLQLSVQSCPVAWTEIPAANGAVTYTCSATPTTLAGGSAVRNVQLTGLSSFASGGTDHLVVSVSLPTTADNSFQGKSAALSVVFTGTQGTGTNR